MFSKKLVAGLGLTIVIAGCAVQSESDVSTSDSDLTTTGCFTVGSGAYKGAVVCNGVGACGTHTGHSFWGTEVLSNGKDNSTGDACCPKGATCNGVAADDRRAFECTNYVMRHFAAMGSQYDIGDAIYTGTMCKQYGENPNFDVFGRGAVPSPEAGDVIVYGHLHTDGSWSGGHTTVITSYEPDTSKVWFNQQNGIWQDRTQLLVTDHTDYANHTIGDRYGYAFHCLIRAKNVCPDVGEKTTAGCSGGATRTCGANHQWGACSQTTACTPKTCAELGGCGSVSASENCGVALDCGACPATTSYAKPWWTGTIQSAGLCAQTTSGGGIDWAACSKRALKQNWSMTKDRYLQSYDSQTCAAPASTTSGAAVEQAACGGTDQVWRFRDMEVVNGNTGDCVDVPAAVYGAGKTLIQWPCHGAGNQRFDYKPRTGELKVNGWCLDAGSAANGAPVTLEVCDGAASQRWNDAHGGFVVAVQTAAPRCLALEGGATAGANAKLVVSDCDDSVEQMWALRGQITHFDESLCMKKSGSGLELASCNATDAAQQLTFWMNF